MTTHRLTDDLDEDLDQALREIAGSEVRHKSVALYDLTKSLFKAGLGQEVAKVVAETKKLIGDIERDGNEEVRLESYANVCKALAITEAVEDVTRLVADFPRITRNQWEDTDIGGAFLTLCESVLDDVDDIEKAIAFIQGIAGDEQRDYAYGHVCKAYARLGQSNDALQLAFQIGDEAPSYRKSFCLSECAEALSGLGASEDALVLARQIPEDSSRSSALFAVAQSLAEMGRDDEARLILEQAQAISGELRSEREFALVRASTILATLGDADEALAVANQIGQERPRYSQAVANICGALASKGDLSEAQSMASNADDWDLVALGIVKGLTSAGDLEEAEKILMGIQDEGQDCEGWETIGGRLSSESNTSEVMRIAEHLPKYSGDGIIRSLIESLAKEGNYQDAVEIVGQRWRSAPISRVESLAAIFRGARIGTPQLDDAAQLKVGTTERPAVVIRSEIAADVGQHTPKESRKKGFFSKLFG